MPSRAGFARQRNGTPLAKLPKRYGDDKWEESPIVEEIRTAKAWGLTPKQWFEDEPLWSREIMLAYETLEAETSAVMAYDDHKRQEKQRKK